MKKIFSFILILFIIPSIFIFTSCNFNKKNYSMKDFYNQYLKISEQSVYLTKTAMPEKFKTENKEIVSFAYSEELQNKISTIPAFSYITNMYNVMLENAMGPTYLHGNNLHRVKLSNKDKEYLHNKLKTLSLNYNEIAKRLGDLEHNQNSTTANVSLINLYSSYEQGILTAIKLSSKISSIFYNKIIETPNKNYVNISENDINLEEVALRTLDRLTYYKLVFTDIYLETKIIGYDVPTKIINGTFNETYTPYDNLKNKIYSNMVKSNIEDYRKDIVNHARTLYIIQLSFEKEYNLYQASCDAIDYGTVNEDGSPYDVGHKHVIDSFTKENGIAYQTYLTIKTILDLCY